MTERSKIPRRRSDRFCIGAFNASGNAYESDIYKTIEIIVQCSSHMEQFRRFYKNGRARLSRREGEHERLLKLWNALLPYGHIHQWMNKHD
jgi:hypothetical protein